MGGRVGLVSFGRDGAGASVIQSALLVGQSSRTTRRRETGGVRVGLGIHAASRLVQPWLDLLDPGVEEAMQGRPWAIEHSRESLVPRKALAADSLVANGESERKPEY
jgi:hypothetical protein